MLCNAVRAVCRNVRNCDASLMSSIKINVITNLLPAHQCTSTVAVIAETVHG